MLKKAFGLLLFILFFITAIKALRAGVHDYAIAHFFITYKYGLIKRALIGTLMTPLLDGRTNEQIVIIINMFSTVVLTLLFTWTFVHWNSLTKHNLLLFCTGFVFFTSSFISFTSNDIGYFDPLLCLISIACLWCIFNNINIVFVIIISICGILIQEIFLLFGLPIVIFALISQSLLKNKMDVISKTDIKNILFQLVVLIIPVILVFFLMLLQKVQTDVIRADIWKLGFVNDTYVYVLLKSFKEGGSVFKEHFLTGFIKLKFVDLLKILPNTVFYIVLSLLAFNYSIKKTANKKLNIFYMLLIPATCFAPLIMFFVAHDVGRRLSFTNFHAFFVFIIILHYTDKNINISSKKFNIILIVSIILFTLFNIRNGIVADALPLMFHGGALFWH
jgi:hypothetical protein